MMSFAKGRDPVLLVLGGVALALAFPPMNLFPLAFIALVPLFLVMRGEKPGGFWRAFRPGFISGLAFFLPLLYWLVFLSSNEVDNPLLMAVPLLLLLAYQAFYWGLFAAGARLITERTSLPRIVVYPLVWTACEYLRSLFMLGFPWGNLGYAGVAVPEAIQFAAVTGLFGVTLWIALVNAVVAEVLALGLRLRGQVPRRFWVLLAALALVILVPIAHGALVLRSAGSVALVDHGASGALVVRSAGPAGKTIRVAVIQPNIGGKRKWDPSYREVSFDVLYALTREAAEEKPDLVVWPETAAPSYLLKDPAHLVAIMALADETGAAILTGFPDRLGESPEEYTYFNSVLLIEPMDALGPNAGTGLVKYDKIHLVPFGEVFPFTSALPFLKRVDVGQAGFTAGQERVVFATEDARFSTLICYESIFPGLVRGFVDEGAQLIVNITNDVWYGRSSMPFQHASMAVMRCIENRRSLARSANSGVSLFADPYGRVTARSEIFTRGFLVADLPLVSEATFYTRHGDLIAWLALAASAVGAAVALVRRRRVSV
jgi:apolipoprotein N-acyltransferase